jgi:hypothetical protein
MKTIRALGVVAFVLVASSLSAAIYTVTNTNDSGVGSLRDAIDQSNSTVGVTDTIAFNITGTGCTGTPTVCTIQPASSLPTLTDPVIIDGYTQAGSSPNTLAVGDNAVLLVEIDGIGINGAASAFRIRSDNTVIKGLVINRFTNPAISIETGQGHVIRGCFIGTDPTGTAAAGSPGPGIFILTSNNTIGGPSPADRNVISANGFQYGANVSLEANNGATVSGTVIQGNYIGTNAAGTAALGASLTGLLLYGATNVTIGGAATGEGNLISGHSYDAIDLSIPNCLSATSSIIIQGNFIGVDATGTLPIPNGKHGIYVGCMTHDTQIGGTAPGAGNLIADNGVPPLLGLGVFLDNTAGTGNAIRANLIYDNEGLGIGNGGIGLGINTVLPNDPGDGDTGPNNKQNFPIISSATPGAGNTHIVGALHSTPSTAFDLDFFSNEACIPFPHGYLEGRIYLGSGVTTTDGSGTGLFDLTVPVQIGAGEHVTATATDPGGNTSEISQRLPFTISPASGPPAGDTFTVIQGTDFAAGAAVTFGGTPATAVAVVNTTTITVHAPALPAGSLNDITVTNTDSSSGTLLKGWVADFLDVPPAYQFYSFVTKLVSNAITVGCGGGDYCPTANVTRAQMAVFLLKAKYGLCYTPPPATGTVFLDVPANSFAAAWIEALFALGVTGGCGNGNYCPGGSVTRAQMAVFLLKTYLGTSYVPPACASVFGDVVCPSTFADWIEDLYTRSITGGCQASPLLYCPGNANTRGQMAVFITKTFGLQ